MNPTGKILLIHFNFFSLKILTVILEVKISIKFQEGRGQWIVNYTGTQSFINKLSHSLAQIHSCVLTFLTTITCHA